jgi:hypothetical protein
MVISHRPQRPKCSVRFVILRELAKKDVVLCWAAIVAHYSISQMMRLARGKLEAGHTPFSLNTEENPYPAPENFQ